MMGTNPYLPVETVIKRELEENKSLSTAERLRLIEKLADLTIARRNYLKKRKENYKPAKRAYNRRPDVHKDEPAREVGDILEGVRNG